MVRAPTLQQATFASVRSCCLAKLVLLTALSKQTSVQSMCYTSCVPSAFFGSLNVAFDRKAEALLPSFCHSYEGFLSLGTAGMPVFSHPLPYEFGLSAGEHRSKS